jgi:hypothetical protein
MTQEYTDFYAGLVEAMARADHEHLGQFGSPGASHPCPPALHNRPEHDPDCDGLWVEQLWPSWENVTEDEREGFREDARRHLAAAFAHRSSVECPTCGGTGRKMRYSDKEQYHDPCPDCSDGRVPLPYRLGVVGEQVGVQDGDGYLRELRNTRDGTPVYLVLDPPPVEGAP